MSRGFWLALNVGLLVLACVAVGSARAQGSVLVSMSPGETVFANTYADGPVSGYTLTIIQPDGGGVTWDSGSDPRDQFFCPESPTFLGPHTGCEVQFSWDAGPPPPEAGFDPSNTAHMLQALFAIGLVLLGMHGWSKGSQT